MLYSTKIFDCFGRSHSTGIGLHLTVCSQLFLCTQQFHTTHTPQNPTRYHPKTPKITLTLFDSPLRTKPNYSLPKLTPQEPQQNTPSPHHLSPTLSNYPTLYKPLINPTQIKKISSKIPHSYNTPVKNFTNYKN